MAPALRSEGGAEVNSMERGGNSMGNSMHRQPCGGREPRGYKGACEGWGGGEGVGIRPDRLEGYPGTSQAEECWLYPQGEESHGRFERHGHDQVCISRSALGCCTENGLKGSQSWRG